MGMIDSIVEKALIKRKVDKICAKTCNPVPQRVLKPTFTVSAA